MKDDLKLSLTLVFLNQLTNETQSISLL